MLKLSTWRTATSITLVHSFCWHLFFLLALDFNTLSTSHSAGNFLPSQHKYIQTHRAAISTTYIDFLLMLQPSPLHIFSFCVKYWPPAGLVVHKNSLQLNILLKSYTFLHQHLLCHHHPYLHPPLLFLQLLYTMTPPSVTLTPLTAVISWLLLPLPRQSLWLANMHTFVAMRPWKSKRHVVL